MSLATELAALRRGAAIAPGTARVLLRVRGEDRSRFLQGMLSNDVAALATGRGTHALLLTEQGRVVGELRVLALPESLLLDVAAERADAVRAALERFVVADDVEIEPLPDVAVALRGPDAARIAGAVLGAEVAALSELEHRTLGEGATEIRVVRLRDLGTDGFWLWSPTPAAAEALAGRLRDAGAVPAGEAALEVVRIGASVAREGTDFDEQTLAPEVPSLVRAISYRKGCYLGQEVVERVAARGHVNWLVMALAGDGDAPPPGAAVRREGTEVGRITSSACDEAGFVAMARLRRTAAEPGATVEVGDLDRPLRARLVEPPPA